MNVPGNGERDPAKIATAIRDLASGGSNALGHVTLAPDATQTIVPDARCAPGAMIVTVPASASAAATNLWLVSTRRGSFTLGHDSSPATDRSFRYEVRRA